MSPCIMNNNMGNNMVNNLNNNFHQNYHQGDYRMNKPHHHNFQPHS